MKCIVPGANVKILARAIHALSKIGDEIYVQPQPKSLSFRAVSPSNSAYSDFTFSDNYFSYYNYGNLNEDDVQKCKVPMRGAIAVFKTPGIMDKVIETCHIRLEPNASQLIFILKYKNSVVKTFLLPIIDCEALKATYKKDGLPNTIKVQPKVLVEALHNFQQTLIEITLDVTPDTIFMRNYVNDSSSVANSTRTQLSLTIGEFDTYTVGENSCVTFCLKELRAILSFAEQVMVPIDITFEAAGKPVVFILKNTAFEGNLVLSTLNPSMQDPNDTAIMRDRRALMKKRGRAGDKRTLKTTTSSKIKKGTSKSSIASTSTMSIVQSILSKDSADSRSITTASTSTSVTTKKRDKNADNNSGNSLAAVLRSTSIDDPLSSDNGEKRTASRTKPFIKPAIIIQESLSPIGSSSTRSGSSIVPATASTQNTEITPSTPKIFSLARRTRPSFDNDDEKDEETIPDSPPPAKRARTIFRKCLQETFDLRFLPGHDEMLADDSDNENT